MSPTARLRGTDTPGASSPFQDRRTVALDLIGLDALTDYSGVSFSPTTAQLNYARTTLDGPWTLTVNVRGPRIRKDGSLSEQTPRRFVQWCENPDPARRPLDAPIPEWLQPLADQYRPDEGGGW